MAACYVASSRKALAKRRAHIQTQRRTDNVLGPGFGKIVASVFSKEHSKTDLKEGGCLAHFKQLGLLGFDECREHPTLHSWRFLAMLLWFRASESALVALPDHACGPKPQRVCQTDMEF
eukprot:1158356-Pelagomonas_calceolata.AAC.8